MPQAMGMKDAYRKTVPSREGGGTFGLHAEPESLGFITSVLENHCRGFSKDGHTRPCSSRSWGRAG